jgi:hypothetical protein
VSPTTAHVGAAPTTPLLANAVAALPALRETSFELSTEEDVAVLRALPQLERVIIPHATAAKVVALPTSPPPLQWRSFSLPRCSLTDGATACLANLPLLRQLDINLSGLTDFAFLASLPALCELTLRGFGAANGIYTQEGWTALMESFTTKGAAAEAAVAGNDGGGIRGSRRLTELRLLSISHCTTVDLRDMLAALPLLHSLHLVDLVPVRSLDCLSAASSLSICRHESHRCYCCCFVFCCAVGLCCAFGQRVIGFFLPSLGIPFAVLFVPFCLALPLLALSFSLPVSVCLPRPIRIHQPIPLPCWLAPEAVPADTAHAVPLRRLVVSFCSSS